MSVEARIWFSPSAKENKYVKILALLLNKEKLPFPGTKANAIVIKTRNPKPPHHEEFPLTKGLTKDFPIPEFAKHEGVSWTKGHLSVEILDVVKTGVKAVDKFNQLVVDSFNLVGGNMLKSGNILTWNVWFTAPEHVNTEEWETHAIKWRESIDSDHGSPDGEGTTARYFDGTPFKPIDNLIEHELTKVLEYIATH